MALPPPPPGFQLVGAGSQPEDTPEPPPGFVIQAPQYDPISVAMQSYNSARAMPAGPQQPQVTKRGMIIPLSEYDDGKVRFDPDAGVAAPITAFVRAWNNIDSSRLPSEQPEIIADATTAGMAAPVDFARRMWAGGPQPGTMGWQSAYGNPGQVGRPTIGSPTGIQTANARAAEAVADIEAMRRQGIREFGPAFAQGPTASVAKQLSETPIVGAPVRNALEETIADTARAVERTADQIGGTRSFDQAGRQIQQGLERFRSAELADLEPGVVQGMGLRPNVQGPPRLVMSQGAQQVAQQAAPIRQQIGANTTQTTRGRQFAAGQPSQVQQQFLTRRTTTEDLTPFELEAVVRAPAEQTSFATRAEALYERAWRQIPDLDRIDGRRNPNMLAAVNTRQALQDIDTNIANQISGQGTIGGPLAERIRNAQASNFTLGQLRGIRTEIGRALSNTNPLQQTLNRTQLLRLYGAVSRDIEIGLETLANRAAIATTRGNNRPDSMAPQDARQAANALRSFRTADRYFRAGIGRVERAYSILQANNPEQAATRLLQAATDGGRGNIQLLGMVQSALRPEEWNEFSSLVLRNLGRPNPSARGAAQEFGFSVQTFLTNWNRMDPRARAAIFNQPGQAQAIDDVVRVVNRLANVEAQINTSRSATNALNVGGVFAAGGALMAGDGGATLLGSSLAGGAASVLLSRPAYARWLATYARLRARALSSRLPITGALAQHISRLEVLARTNPELRGIAAAVAAENGVEPIQPEEKDG